MQPEDVVKLIVRLSEKKKVAPLISSLISLWLFRVVLVYLFISVLHMDAAAYRWCLNLDQFVRMSAMLIFYFSGR